NLAWPLGNGGRCGRASPLARRELALWLAGRADWCKDFPAALIEAFNELSRWRRGFVERLTLLGAEWIAQAGAILAAQPVRTIRLLTWPAADDTGELPPPQFSVESWRQWLSRHWPGIR